MAEGLGKVYGLEFWMGVLRIEEAAIVKETEKSVIIEKPLASYGYKTHLNKARIPIHRTRREALVALIKRKTEICERLAQEITRHGEFIGMAKELLEGLGDEP